MKNLFYLIFINLSFLSFSQDTSKVVITDTTDFSKYSLEELIKLKSSYNSTDMEKLINSSIEVASRKPLSIKKSPSVVSVITDEEINKSGARDLIDILQMVPGIELNGDVFQSVSISIRGLSAQEGKVLLMIDGQEMNEIDYGTVQLFQQYPINQIKKIEIIRGPGSANYGGYAEYLVINILTKNATDLNGLHLSSSVGQTKNATARTNFNLAFGGKHKDLEYTVSGYANKGIFSNQIYTDVYGASYDLKKNSNILAYDLNIGLKYKGFSARFIKNNLYTSIRDGYGSVLSKKIPTNYLTNFIELKHQKQLSKTFQIQSKINLKLAQPWQSIINENDSLLNTLNYHITTNRFRLNATGIWDIHRTINIVFGIDSYYDEAIKHGTQLFLKDSTKRVTYFNYAPYVQTLFKTRFANITAGLRYDVNTAFGSSLNPRLGVTKKIGFFNIKALYASSFRAPSIENIQSSYSTKILPEQTKTAELEFGFQLGKLSYLTLNAFDITTKNAINYVVTLDSNSYTTGYLNSSKNIGSQGFEIEYKLKSTFGAISSSYSFYTVGNKNINEYQAIPNRRNESLGIANHKANIQATINLTKNLFLSSSLHFIGERFGYTSVDINGEGLITKYAPQHQLNLYFGTMNLKNGLNFGFGIRNITNQKMYYIQPYNGLHNSLIGMGREFTIKINYSFIKKSK